MLDCYAYAAFSVVMYVLHFLYAGFWRLPSVIYIHQLTDVHNRQNNFFIKILMFIGYIHQLTNVHNLCSS
jgi:hypothetical protein